MSDSAYDGEFLNKGTPGYEVKQAIDNITEQYLGDSWRNLARVASGGFFKGALLTAAVVLGGGLVGFGVLSSMGAAGFGAFGGAFEAAAAAGAGQAATFLTSSGVGALTTLFGGALGALNEMRKHQAETAGDSAEIRYNDLNHTRTVLEKTKELEKTPAVELDDTTREVRGNTTSFLDRELAKSDERKKPTHDFHSSGATDWQNFVSQKHPEAGNSRHV